MRANLTPQTIKKLRLFLGEYMIPSKRKECVIDVFGYRTWVNDLFDKHAMTSTSTSTFVIDFIEYVIRNEGVEGLIKQLKGIAENISPEAESNLNKINTLIAELQELLLEPGLDRSSENPQ